MLSLHFKKSELIINGFNISVSMVKTFCCILTIFILLGTIFPSFAQTQPWKKLQSPVNVTLRFMSFVDSLTGWAAGEAGTIIRTTDGAENWDIQNSTVQTFIMDIFFVDKNFGWALTLRDEFPFNSILLKTTDGGINWQQESFPDSSNLIRTIFFFDSLNGFVGGSYIAYTSDGGINWTKADVDSSLLSGFPVYRFNFFNRQLGYACGGRIDVAGVIWRTTDGGLNWSAQGVSADEVFDIHILDSLNAITLSGDPEGLYPIADLKTTNAGINWIYDELPYFGLSFRIDFRTYNEGWSASGYKFLLTTNRGETWEEFETPDSAVVYDIQFLDARTGYAVGENGAILKLDPTLVGVEKELPSPEDFILYQNYPNPFNPTTKIKFTIPSTPLSLGEGLGVRLAVYDVLGNEIAVLVDEFKQAGKYEVEFNASSTIRNLASGIYFYQLMVRDPEINSGQGMIQVKKMILLK
jgi:photosystem II stability/assembly factor-like uncharacterized protein